MCIATPAEETGSYGDRKMLPLHLEHRWQMQMSYPWRRRPCLAS
jgi:hypothetical protein